MIKNYKLYIEPYSKLTQAAYLLVKSLREIYRVSPFVCNLLIIAIIISGTFPSIFIKTTSDIIQILSESGKGRASALAISFSIWGTAILTQNIISPIILYLQSILADKLTFHVHSRLISKANSFESVEAFDNEEFHNRLELIRTQASHKPLNTVVTVVGLSKELIITFSCLGLIYHVLNWKAGLMIVCAVINALIFVRIQNLVWQDSLSRSKKSRFLNYLSALSISTKFINEIRFFGYAKHIESMYKKHAEELYTESQYTRRKIVMKALFPLMITMLITIYLTYGITIQISSGLLTIGAIAILVQSILQLQMAVNSLSEQAGWIRGHILFFEKYFEFVDTINIGKQQRKIKISRGAVTIEFKNVNFCYDENTPALANINFKINPKERIAIVGANGAGKSTFVKLLCGLYKPTQGDMLVNGVSIREIDINEWRRKISPVFQDFCTYDFSVRENITCDQPYDNEKLLSVIKRSEINNIKIKLEAKVGRSFGGLELSTGQWQKIAIARALYNNGDIFILDEPTASLDPISEYEIFKKFETISKGKTVVFVTHRLNSIVMADRIIFMDSGKIIDEGKHDDLMSRCDKYKEMFNKQSKHFLKLAKI